MSETAASAPPATSPRSGFRRQFTVLRNKAIRLGIVAILTIIGSCLIWFEPQSILLLREWVWDEMVRAKPRAYAPERKVLVVDIDEASLAVHGQWPWPRARMANLIDALHAYGVRAIGFDVIFAEPDRTTLSRVFESLKRDVPGYTPPLDAAALATQPDNDDILAAAMQKLPVVLALSVEERELPGTDRKLESLPRVRFERRKDQRYLPRFPGAVSALPELQKAAAANASIDPRVDQDGITRRAPLLFKIGKRTVPSLAVALAHAAVDGDKITVGTRSPGVRWLTVRTIDSIPYSPPIPTDRYGQMRLYDSGTQQERYVSAAAVLDKSAPAEKLKDAIVIVGTGAEGLNDLRLTPLNNWVPGMETHAQFVEQILSGAHLSRPELGRTLELAGTIAIGLLLLLSIYGNWAKVPPWAIAVFASGAFAIVAWVLFAKFGRLVDPLVPAATVLCAAALDRFLLVLELRRERSAVRGAFARYLAPAVVEQLAEYPDRLTLGGERREMTFLFCDIRGFTAISEQFRDDPEGLTNLINRFLTPMTNEIMNRGGTIDKYMGDCIMAFWNAPLDDSQHAQHASEAALAMQESLKALNAEIAAAAQAANKPFTIRAGVGLNTGNCVVGNMGSEQRFDYSVLGDDVNLASRLEGQSKTYGVDILIGESTQDAAPEFAALEVDLIAVKGRTAAVRVFALLGDNALRDSDGFKQLAEAQAALLSNYRKQRWAAARTDIATCRGLARIEWKLDTLYDLYEERIDAFEAAPPDSDWDGVYVADSK